MHRDIKPANLLLDVQGDLWITDFGLARLQDDAGLTITGDLLGTLRYMSPEQALAKRGYLDHRTDIYSLGATLYELVTLRPAIDGLDRQDVLRKIAQEEPAPPRRLNPVIPSELETILLKAMNKEPESRYATAQELADDLRRFLEDKPIKAKRPTPLERVTKWTRRHAALVGASVTGLALAAVGLLIATVLATSAYRREAQQRELAQAQRGRAEANFRRAQDAVDQMLTEVSEKSLAEIPQAQPVRRALLEKAAVFYRELLAEQVSDPALRYESAQAYSRLARVEAELGRLTQAAEAFRGQITLLQELLKGEPEHAEYLRDLVWAHFRLAWQLRGSGDLASAMVETGRAVEIAQRLVDRFRTNPTDRKALARSLDVHAVVLWQTGKLLDAETAFNRSVEIDEQLIRENPADAPHGELAAALSSLAGLRNTQGKHNEAVALLERAIAHQQDAFKTEPKSDGPRQFLRNLYENLAVSLAKLGKPEEALKAASEIIAMGQALVTDHPAHPSHRRELAESYQNLAGILKGNGRLPEAETSYRRAIEIGERLTAEFPDMPEPRRTLVWSHNDLGLLLEETARFKEARDSFSHALSLSEDLMGKFPGWASSPEILADVSNGLAWLLATCTDPQIRNPAEAVKQAKKAVELDPQKGSYWDTLGIAYCRARDWDSAVKALMKASELNSGGAANTWFFLATAHWQKGEKDQARQSYDKAVTLMEKNKPQSAELLRFRAEAAALLGVTDHPAPTGEKEANTTQQSKP